MILISRRGVEGLKFDTEMIVVLLVIEGTVKENTFFAGYFHIVTILKQILRQISGNFGIISVVFDQLVKVTRTKSLNGFLNKFTIIQS